MATKKVSLKAGEGLFEGLAKQNLQYHQCIFELTDNAIAAAKEGCQVCVDIIMQEAESGFVDVWVCDNGRGMDFRALGDALQPGKKTTSSSRLNEHGLGLKNALATLSGGNGKWTLWTRTTPKGRVCSVSGPFSDMMTVETNATFPTDAFLPKEPASTVICVKVKREFVQTVQGRGGHATQLATLRSWLIEHLGVTYRGYLEFDARRQATAARISVSIVRKGKDGNCQIDSKLVPALPVPFASMKIKRFSVCFNEEDYELEYRYGTLDRVVRDNLLGEGQKAKYYYQGSQSTQGIDIRLGKRVIATRQLEAIWGLSRHNNYNYFVGELLIPEDIPKEVLTTVNNKTDFNLQDLHWKQIFDCLKNWKPIEHEPELREKELQARWVAMIKATNPRDSVSREMIVWPTAMKIDVYREKEDGHRIIYELKTGAGEGGHLTQLQGYWNGLLHKGIQPNEAVLIVKRYNNSLAEMAAAMNEQTPPKLDGKESLPYNFQIKCHSEVGLDNQESEKA